MSTAHYPRWVVLHIPHDSTDIPTDVRFQLLLSDAALRLELQRMTDHFTHRLFAGPSEEAAVIRAPVSRRVVDVDDVDVLVRLVAVLVHRIAVDEHQAAAGRA